MSKILRKLRQKTSGKEDGPNLSAKKQRFIDATKSLLDISTESADVFPPLKSCLGCINALVKYYEGCKDVEEKLGDLVLWLTKLKDSVTTTSAHGNREETERREQLTRSLEHIEKRSQILLDKGKSARILDKRQDSGTVVKLVEELRQAILIYQLSQQQSIDNRVTQLVTSFSAFLKLRERAPEIREKTESTLARLSRLTTEGSAVGGKGESKRMMVLAETLEGIKEKLRCILERISVVGYRENEADAHAVGELAEDVRDAIIEYQFGQQNAIHEQNCRLIDSADLSVLNNCRRAKAAEYRHGNRRGCLKGTRGAVLDEIESWAKDLNKSPVFWLNGLAGTGKSTIAQTIAERLFAEGNLGASFFCSRDFEDRSNLGLIFPTLAFQLAHKYPEFRAHFVPLLRSNPDVVHESLCSQMEKLIVEPLRETGISTVIVIDALDECKDDEPSSAILSVLGRFVEEIPEAKFFITGRPEQRIKTGFRLPLLVDSTDVFSLHDVHPPSIENDIRIFLRHDLSELAQRRQLEGWPSDDLIDLLCRRAAGFFIHAVATVKFLDSNSHLPKRRLDVILKLPESSAPEGKTRLNSGTTLDSLYTSILRAAFIEEDPEVDSKVRATIGTIIVVVNPLPPSAIAELSGLEPAEVMLYLELVQSLLVVDEDPHQPVKPFHKSFPDFITDPSRCADPRFCVSPEGLHLDLTTNCLRLMNDGLDQDLLSLPEYSLNSEIKDLQTRIDSRISIALQYACRSWHNHLAKTRGEIFGVIPYLHTFLEEKFLAWLEVLSVLGDVGSASVALEKLVHWLQEFAKDSQLLDTAQDCFHFVTKFFEPISISATHIYHSALELCPTSSIVRKLYYDRCHGITRFPRVVIGTPDSWDLRTSFAGKDDYQFCTWSPCGRFVAARTKETVEIRNRHTFELLIDLRSTKNVTPFGSPPTYSPDGRSLACRFSDAIFIWDIQTGGVVKEIESRAGEGSLVWSLDGRVIVNTIYQHGGLEVDVYDVASGVQLFAGHLASVRDRHLWAYKESFRFARISAHSSGPTNTIKVTISEIGSPPIEIESLSFPSEVEIPSFPRTTFFPSAGLLSIADRFGDSPLLAFNTRDSGCLLHVKSYGYASCQFSSDGRFFAASHKEGVQIWNYAPGGYVLWGTYRFPRSPTQYHSCYQFSPNSSSILAWDKNVLRLQSLDNPPTAPKTRAQYAAISRSGSLVATAHKSERTVTIIDLHSQAPSQFIDTGVEIDGLFITGNVLLVVNSEQIVAWLVAGEGSVDGLVDDKRAGLSDSIWTTSSPLRQPGLLCFRVDVEDQVGAIGNDVMLPFVYHTETGDILDRAHEPRPSPCPWFSFYDLTKHWDYRYLRYQNPPPHDATPGDGWLISPSAIRETGWVLDPEGRRRFWVPVEWRGRWDCKNWYHDITTLFTRIGDQPIIVKF